MCATDPVSSTTHVVCSFIDDGGSSEDEFVLDFSWLLGDLEFEGVRYFTGLKKELILDGRSPTADCGWMFSLCRYLQVTSLLFALITSLFCQFCSHMPCLGCINFAIQVISTFFSSCLCTSSVWGMNSRACCVFMMM